MARRKRADALPLFLALVFTDAVRFRAADARFADALCGALFRAGATFRERSATGMSGSKSIVVIDKNTRDNFLKQN